MDDISGSLPQLPSDEELVTFPEGQTQVCSTQHVQFSCPDTTHGTNPFPTATARKNTGAEFL